MVPPSDTETSLRDEVQRLRQLLQAGVVLASAVLAGDDVKADLKAWVAAATTRQLPPDHAD